MKKIPFAVLLIFVFCSVVFAAIKDSPDGFRDMKWGDPVSKLGASTLVEEVDGIQAYIKHNDNLKVGDVNLTAITYVFMEKKFIYAMLTSKGANNNIALRATLVLRYGLDFEETPIGLMWADTNAAINYQPYPEQNMAVAIIGNAMGLMKTHEVMEKSASSGF